MEQSHGGDMQNKNKVLCVLLFFLQPFFIYTQNNDIEAWWAQTTQLYEQSTNMQAARTITEVEELDGRGRIRSSEIIETRYEWIDNEERIIVLRNGIDASDSLGQRNIGTVAGFDAMPFDPRYVSSTVRNNVSMQNNNFFIAYTIATEAGPVEGIARFSSDGLLMFIEQNWVRPPSAIRMMKCEYYFEYQNGIPLISRTAMEVSVSVLLIRRHFRINTVYSQWIRKP